MDLVNQLKQNLGVTEEQARGGAGLIMRIAKQKLASGEYDKVANTIPGLENIIKAAPEPGTVQKVLSSITSKTSTTEDITRLSGGFSKLGLSTDMVGKFIPIVLSYVESQGGNTTRTILESVLKRT